MATIRDIAQQCQLSIATVSYVLNGKAKERHITHETEAKVLAVAKEMGYSLPIARKPEKDAIRVLLLWPWSCPNHELMSIFSGMEQAKRECTETLDISIRLFQMHYLESEWGRIAADGYDIALIYALTPKDMAFLASQTEKPGLFITINRRISGCASVNIDNIAAGRLACEALFSQCGNSISAIIEDEFAYARTTRSQAFRDRAKELGIPLEKHLYTCSVIGSYDEGYRYAREFIRRGTMTKGVYFTHDHTAVGFLAGMQKSGIVAGKDFWMMATGLGSQDLCRYSTPSITALDLKMEETTLRAVRLGLDILNGKTPVDTVITLEPGIIFRDTLPSPEW